MRCLACDCLLTDFESTRRSAISGAFIDLCNSCMVPLETTENMALYEEETDILPREEADFDKGVGPDSDEDEDQV